MANIIYDNKICPCLFENTTFRIVFYLEIDWIFKYARKNFSTFQLNRNLNVTSSSTKKSELSQEFLSLIEITQSIVLTLRLKLTVLI